jgi:hypothetical protein
MSSCPQAYKIRLGTLLFLLATLLQPGRLRCIYSKLVSMSGSEILSVEGVMRKLSLENTVNPNVAFVIGPI